MSNRRICLVLFRGILLPLGVGILLTTSAIVHADRRRPTLTSDVPSRSSLATEVSLALASDERRDLALLVELSQRVTPAILEYPHTNETMAVLQIAHSRAFEAQLRARQKAAGYSSSGPVLVFSLEPASASLTTTNLSFSQRGAGFRPSAADPREFGWIHDREAGARLGKKRLGYIVLPAFFELSRPLVIFWGDSVAATTLRR